MWPFSKLLWTRLFSPLGKSCRKGYIFEAKIPQQQFPRSILVDMCDISRGCYDDVAPVGRLSRLAHLIGRPAVCCGVVLPVCPCVVSFSKVHEPDTHDLLRTSR